MMKPIFQREDFSLCNVPVPKGYPQSQTHSGIVLYDGNYYLTTSPYPGKKYPTFIMHVRSLIKKLTRGNMCNPPNGEVYENPCIYIGDSNDDKVPTTFKPLSERPLMDTPEYVYGLPAYNSDPDILIENGRAYILNRTVYRTKWLHPGYECITDIYLIEGSLCYEKFKLDTIRLIKEWDKPYASPCLTKFRGKYIFSYLDTNSALDAKTFNGLYLQELDDICEIRNNKSYRNVQVHTNDMLPWHMSLFSYNDTLYTIIACVKRDDTTKKIWQMFGEFNNDLTELTVYTKPLTDFNSYRGAALIREDGLFVLYSSVVGEYLSGSMSVDGRDIVMANCPFIDLLHHIKAKI